MSAKMSKTSCTCAKCVGCCKHYPGWMTVAEAKKAIDAGYGPRLMRDWWAPDTEYGNTDRIDVLCPAARGYEGTDAPEIDIFTLLLRLHRTCTLLVRNRCSIHDSGFKPKMCRQVFGCTSADLPKIKMVKDWDTPRGRAVVAQWMQAQGVAS